MWKSRGSPELGHAVMGFPGGGVPESMPGSFPQRPGEKRENRTPRGCRGWQFRGVFMGKRAGEQFVPLSGNRE